MDNEVRKAPKPVEDAQEHYDSLAPYEQQIADAFQNGEIETTEFDGKTEQKIKFP